MRRRPLLPGERFVPRIGRDDAARIDHLTSRDTAGASGPVALPSSGVAVSALDGRSSPCHIRPGWSSVQSPPPDRRAPRRSRTSAPPRRSLRRHVPRGRAEPRPRGHGELPGSPGRPSVSARHLAQAHRPRYRRVGRRVAHPEPRRNPRPPGQPDRARASGRSRRARAGRSLRREAPHPGHERAVPPRAPGLAPPGRRGRVPGPWPEGSPSPWKGEGFEGVSWLSP